MSWSGRAQAVPYNFSAGSLIIPMDVCYQPSSNYLCSDTTPTASCVAKTAYKSNFYTTCPESQANTPAKDGILKAYGLVYRLLQKGIPIYYIVETNPTLKSAINATDMTITNPVGTPPVTLLDHTTGLPMPVSFMAATHSSIAYRGGPFVISAADAPKAKALLTTDSTFTAIDPRTGRGVFEDVYIHQALTNMLGVSVKALLTQAPPKIAIMDIGGDAVNVLIGYLKDAGLYNSTAFGIYPNIGDVFTQFQQVTDFTGGGLSAFSILWMPHWEGATVGTASSNAILSAINTFNKAGNSVFAECAAATTMEQYANGHFVTTGSGTSLSLSENKLPEPWPGSTAGQGYAVNPDNVPLVWSNSLVQIGDYPMSEISGALFDFTPASGLAYRTGAYRLVSSTAPSNQASYQNHDLEVVLPPAGSSTAGPVIYLGGHAYGTDTSGCSSAACSGLGNTAGCQKSYGSNAVCIGNCCVYPQTNIVGTERLVFNTLIFLGQIPQNTELTRSSPIVYSDGKTYLGTYVQQTLPNTTFPPWNGHFREYPSGSLAGTNVTAFGTPGADWDSSLNIANQAVADKRTIFTGVQKTAGGPWVQTAFNTTNAVSLGVLPTTVTAIRQGGLGGIDHSIPAIIGPSTVAGSPLRPTVAYVGALDGMLHAILVSDPNGLAKGFSPGDELWAFIPPAQLTKVVNQNGGVDGSPSVGDAFITQAGSKVWRTLLAVPDANYGGTLDTLDITDPLNPVFLWEASDTVTAGGKTYVMGRAQGSAVAPITTTSGLHYAYFVVTDNSSGTAGNAFNMYALDAGTGAVLWRFNHLYTNDTTHNDVPGMVSVIDSVGDGGPVDRTYFGDLEGKVWQVPAATGPVGIISPIYDASLAHGFSNSINYPMESGVVLYRSASADQLSLVTTTGGADWVPSTTLSYVVNINLVTKAYSDLFTLPINERVYAAPTVFGNNVYFISSAGNIQVGVGSDLAANGAIYRINLGTAGGTTQLASVKQGASEVAVDASGNVLAASVSGITQNANAGVDNSQTVYKLQSTTPKSLVVRAWLDLF